MFEKTALRRPADIAGLGELDIGALAESLLFYEKTALVLDPGSAPDLLRTIGGPTLSRLVRSDMVDVFYLPDMTTLPNAGALPAAGYGISTVSVPDWQIEKHIPTVFADVIGRPGAARRLSSAFLHHATVISPNDLRSVDINELIAREATTDQVRAILSNAAPAYEVPSELRFGVTFEAARGFHVDTNLDMNAVSRVHQTAFHTTNEVTISHLLITLASMYEDVGAAAYLGSDITLTPLRSDLILLRGTRAESREASESTRLLEIVFEDSRAIREAVRSGEVSFDKALDIAEHAGQFKKWLAGQAPDADLVKTFFREATHETWIDRLPAATARWLFVTGSGSAAGLAVAGPVGIAAGPVISAVDFVAERLRQRWTPSQFLLRRLRSTFER